jgi:hypothetical protein
MERLVPGLVHRGRAFISERLRLEKTKEELPRRIEFRERDLHLVRSETAAEISALKAERTGAENERNRATADREEMGNKLVEISRFDGLMME